MRSLRLLLIVIGSVLMLGGALLLVQAVGEQRERVESRASARSALTETATGELTPRQLSQQTESIISSSGSDAQSRYWRAYRLLSLIVAQPLPQGTDSTQTLERLVQLSDAVTLLEAEQGEGSPARRSQILNLLGVARLYEVELRRQEPRRVKPVREKAKRLFIEAVLLDAQNSDAKHNLELMLQVEQNDEKKRKQKPQKAKPKPGERKQNPGDTTGERNPEADPKSYNGGY